MLLEGTRRVVCNIIIVYLIDFRFLYFENQLDTLLSKKGIIVEKTILLPK